ncbi:MAG: HAD-IA family hydrolase [Trueperaceae bacterium]
MQSRSPGASSGALPDLTSYQAVLFDLDGVLTPTAEVHMRAWAALFEPFLASLGDERPYTEQDYFDHIDGKQRYQGVAELLASRGVELPWGDPGDAPDARTVCGLGNRKNLVFQQVLEEQGVKPYPGSLALLDRLEAAGTRMAVVSSSRNARTVLAAAGLAQRFAVVVDGASAAAEGLPSKPDPATYLRAAQLLDTPAAAAVVVEDALSGVEAGRRGEFALVVGVDRGAGAAALTSAGADLVVADLAELVHAGAPGFSGPSRFGSDEWRLVESSPPTDAQRGAAETLFAVGNGYLGLRGNPDEGGLAYEHGTFINGFHETWPIHYPEKAYGFAEVGQTILNLPDAKTTTLEVDGEQLDLETSELVEYERVLDMGKGTLQRRLVWRLKSGARVALSTRRMVSFVHKHLALLSYTLTPLDADADVTWRSLLLDRQAEPEATRPDEADGGAGFDPRQSEDMSGALRPALHGVTDADATYLAHVTRGSELGLAVMATHLLEGASAAPVTHAEARRAETAYSFSAAKGKGVTLHKLVAYHDGGADELPELVAAAGETLNTALRRGAAALFEEQATWLAEFWADADVQVAAQPAVQQALRWNLFQLLQSAARADGRGVSAKGVSGSGYSGHYFWDTEIYVLPFLIHSRPEMARNALLLRYGMLPAARRRAATMSEAGALFPWRTINGEEASAYYPAGTAQYHINADVAYAIARYLHATGDEEFMAAHGVEMLVETARLWLSLGFFKARTGQFHINGVTGPDEYSAVVDDNFYTNVMAAFNLRFAADALAQLERGSPSAHEGLVSRLSIQAGEPAEWRRAAEAMALPYDEELGVHMQDARWLERERWDFEGTPASKRPLLLHFHPLVIYRHQVLKQTDLVLALYLQSGLFTLPQKRADFDYYDPLTTGDSSLSAAVQSIVAAEVGHAELALTHFEQMLYTDLADLHANTADGVHVASAGGTWQAVVAGFGGVREDGGVLRFDPRLPAAWRSLAFVVRTRGAKVRAHISHSEARFELLEGAEASFEVRGKPLRLSGPEPVSVSL